MKIRIFAQALVITAAFIYTATAYAAYNPCARQESIYNSAVRNLDRWSTEVLRRQDEAYRLEERIQVRSFDLANQIQEAQAYAQYISGLNGADAAHCGFSFFFGRNASCIASAARAAIARNRSAQYRIQAAQARYNLYQVQAAGLRQRQAQRIVDSQNFVNFWNQQVAGANASVSSCIASSTTSGQVF